MTCFLKSTYKLALLLPRIMNNPWSWLRRTWLSTDKAYTIHRHHHHPWMQTGRCDAVPRIGRDTTSPRKKESTIWHSILSCTRKSTPAQKYPKNPRRLQHRPGSRSLTRRHKMPSSRLHLSRVLRTNPAPTKTHPRASSNVSALPLPPHQAAKTLQSSKHMRSHPGMRTICCSSPANSLTGGVHGKQMRS